jgi:ion channel-forming bestrophin family protein
VSAARDLLRGAVAHSGEIRGLAPLVTAYVIALKQHLRNGELDELDELLEPTLRAEVRVASNPPTRIALELSRWVAVRGKDRRIAPVMVRTLEERITDLVEHQGAC